MFSSALYLAIIPAAQAADQAATNIDSALQKLALHAALALPDSNVAGPHGQIARISALDRAQTPGRFDAQDRVLVHVHLDGSSSMDEVTRQVQSLKAQVLAGNATYRHGIFAAYLPTDQIANIAKIKGVRALTMEHAPQVRVGKYTSQGAAILRTDLLNNAGLKGDGITVGVLSDSFNTARFNTASPPAADAAQDVKTGDLPVVNVLEDFGGPGNPGTDEGRAICQIVYDEAPHCNLAFATAFVSEVDFANNIVKLRTQAGCSVIDDDIGYFDEPVFSDGLLADAVNTVVNSTSLPGKPVIYTSSAGNDGNNGYRDSYRQLTDKEVRNGNHGNLQLDKVPEALTAGGWHNWNPNGGVEPVTTVTAPGPNSFQYDIFLQWDDPFDQDHGVTTNYNFLVFDQNGNYLPDLSGTTDAFSTQQPFQGIGNLDLGVVYQIAITKSTQTDPKAGRIPKTHQFAMYTTLDGASTLIGKYFIPYPPPIPNIYGHPAADSAIAVAAYAFNWKPAPPYLPQFDNFSSPGPVTIYFDQNNSRLASPVTRFKPEVAGIDGVITTFFGPGYYNYPFAFFGTSASAPSVAGVVALMLQEAGGAGSLDVRTVKTALENSAAPRTSTTEMTQALGASSASFVSVTADGQVYFGSNYFTVNYRGSSGNAIGTLTIDGSKAGLVFDTTAFAIGTTVGLSAADVQIAPVSTATSKFTLTFKAGSFQSGNSISFTLGQDVPGKFSGFTQGQFGVGSEAEDLGFGATFAANFAGKPAATVRAAFLNGAPTFGYSQFDGFGLIDAVGAVQGLSSASGSQQLSKH